MFAKGNHLSNKQGQSNNPGIKCAKKIQKVKFKLPPLVEPVAISPIFFIRMFTQSIMSQQMQTNLENMLFKLHSKY